MNRIAILCAIFVFTLWTFARAQDAPLSPFTGTWVGTQSWAIENPPPGAREPQTVTLTVELIDGKLVGTMTPFFGGSDGVRFVDATVDGDRVQAAARVTPPSPPASAAGAQAQPRRLTGWKANAQVKFTFQNDGNRLTGTADVLLGEIPWAKFAYDLSRKRSRY